MIRTRSSRYWRLAHYRLGGTRSDDDLNDIHKESAAMNLKDYEQEKFAIGDIIRSAQSVINNDEVLKAESRDLLT